MTSIGFTGTRSGMTIEQWKTVEHLLWLRFASVEGPHEWHDGDCVGADSQAHAIVEKINKSVSDPVKLHGHLPNHDQYRAFKDFDVEHEPKAYLARNRDIVAASDVMLAAPGESYEVQRGSGTWATIRHARLKEKPLILIWPDGTFTIERIE